MVICFVCGQHVGLLYRGRCRAIITTRIELCLQHITPPCSLPAWSGDPGTAQSQDHHSTRTSRVVMAIRVVFGSGHDQGSTGTSPHRGLPLFICVLRIGPCVGSGERTGAKERGTQLINGTLRSETHDVNGSSIAKSVRQRFQETASEIWPIAASGRIHVRHSSPLFLPLSSLPPFSSFVPSATVEAR